MSKYLKGVYFWGYPWRPCSLPPCQSWQVKDEPYHLKCTWLCKPPQPPPPSISPWAFCVICWDLNLLLLFNKSTAIKIGLQLCFRLPNDIRAWNIFFHDFFFFPPLGFVSPLIPPSNLLLADRRLWFSTSSSPPSKNSSLQRSRSAHLWDCWHED